jgi:diguanylate cyclase (GGDEF)-like protein
MKKAFFKMASALCALFAALSVTTAYASVDFTTDGAADQASVYVAGSPDCFPVESYDADSGTYKGAAPAFLSLAAKQTHLKFVYIRAGEQDRRDTLAKNNQVDLLFATADETALLSLGTEKIKLFSVTKKGVPTDVYCVFTSVCGENERAAIRSTAAALTKDDIAQLLTADTSQSVSQRQFHFVLIVLGGALLCVVIALIVLLILFFRRKRKKEAFVDTATEIGNKKYFMQMFGSTIFDQTRELYSVVHFAFAIDWVNGYYGVEESDEILKYAADTITQRLKDNEFCARIGGGSFAAAIYANGADQIERRVVEILRVLNAYGEKYGKEELHSLFRAGICTLAADDKNVEKVLYNADQAYRHAVEEKKEFVFVNHDVLNEHTTKVSIREQAGDALEQHAFTPYVQFIVNAKDGSICGGELLSRWENRLYGLLTPGSYIPILQDMKMIVRHDLMMLEEACKLLEQWQSCGKSYFLTCNLTRVTISDPSLVEEVSSIAERYSFAKEKLVLEVTEDSIEEDKESALHNMLKLKEQGFRIALDDFSSGYTAVSNLYEYAVDLVKLDRQMIIDADRNPHAASLMKEITKLCHELQIRVLAEGVENEDQVRLAHSVLCDYIQGFFYARALPLRELSGFEENYRAKPISGCEESDGVFEKVSAETPAERPSEVPSETPVEMPAAPTVTPAAASDEPTLEEHVDPPAEEEPSGETQGSSNASAAAPPVEKPEKETMIRIQYGPYSLDLPGNIDIDPVSAILRAIQEKMDETHGPKDEC